MRAQLRRDAGDLTEFAAAQVRIPTENPPGDAYAKCAALIASRLRRLGLATRTVDPTGAAPSVIATFGERGPALYFSGHYDVVPAQHRGQFAPTVRKAHLYGRGAARGRVRGGVRAGGGATAVPARAEAPPRLNGPSGAIGPRV